MRLKNPEFLLLLIMWIPMVWIYIRRERRFRPAVQYSDLSVLSRIPPSLTVRLRHLPFVLRLTGFGLLVVALSRPREGHTEEEQLSRGVDIVLTLDVSTSMKALDFKPENRLYVAKETMKKFISGREHDRIGLVVFAARAFTKCPLTLDYGILSDFIDVIEFGNIEDGTAIGTAIATAANRLKDSKAKSKIVILATDGANNAGEISPVAAANAAAKLGVKIYTIGVGKEGEVPYPFRYQNPWTGKTETKVQMVESELDEQSLVDIADVTGGRFFRAHNAEKLKEIYDIINKMEKSEIKTKSYTNYSERFFPWLLAGALILLAELILVHTRFRRVP